MILLVLISATHTRTHAHAHTHAHASHTHAHIYAHTHVYAHTHAHTHTRTHERTHAHTQDAKQCSWYVGSWLCGEKPGKSVTHTQNVSNEWIYCVQCRQWAQDTAMCCTVYTCQHLLVINSHYFVVGRIGTSTCSKRKISRVVLLQGTKVDKC